MAPEVIRGTGHGTYEAIYLISVSALLHMLEACDHLTFIALLLNRAGRLISGVSDVQLSKC